MPGMQLLEPRIQLEQLTRHDRHRAVKNDLKHFFQQEMNIIHFACHTRAPIQGSRDPTNEQFCLLLSKSNDLALWISDLYMTRLGNHPLVVLNACGTTPREVDATWNMVNAFLQNGACGVVTTECEVPDALAAAFTLQFYPLLLAGHELGVALFETRHKLLRPPNHNPLGLLYAMYAHPKTRIIGIDQINS
jgi:CHAT domain-containing protein